ncbi:helix-turn-helix domain-containing protein, partial [Klebsiella aerogenes]|uniref:helix-turn-helix domain-containing protein n=1 Tax=Klebsiella aerogenes TaxID=548 RepID=UPI001115759E
MITNEREKVAMFRYGVIAALVCRRLENKLVESSVREEILSKEWQYPDGSMRKVPDRTLRQWVHRYRNYGLDGLYDGLRKDRTSKGRFRAIPEAVLK